MSLLLRAALTPATLKIPIAQLQNESPVAQLQNDQGQGTEGTADESGAGANDRFLKHG